MIQNRLFVGYVSSILIEFTNSHTIELTVNMINHLSYIEISRDRLIHNVQSFRSFINNDVELAVVVKGNAYGHGQNEVAAAINDYVDYFQVDDFEEFKSLKNVVSKPILILGYVAKHEIEEALSASAILAIYDIERLEIINALAGKLHQRAKVHVKIDAELGRQGLLLSDLDEFVERLRKMENITLDAIYAHFANIEDTDDFTHAEKQLRTFRAAKAFFAKSGFNNLKSHISATSGILVYDKDRNENKIVRLGIGLYGMWPSENLKNKYQNVISLKPVLKWVTHIAQIKTLPAGYTVGYGLTYKTERATTIAVIPQGYSDGYDRGLSNKGEVLIHETRCKILGRVAMNMFVVDISKLKNVKLEDEVVLLGEQGDKNISAEELASKIDTINYEITTRISPTLKRIIKA